MMVWVVNVRDEDAYIHNAVWTDEAEARRFAELADQGGYDVDMFEVPVLEQGTDSAAVWEAFEGDDEPDIAQLARMAERKGR